MVTGGDRTLLHCLAHRIFMLISRKYRHALLRLILTAIFSGLLVNLLIIKKGVGNGYL
jgi:hypothetical protein